MADIIVADWKGIFFQLLNIVSGAISIPEKGNGRK